VPRLEFLANINISPLTWGIMKKQKESVQEKIDDLVRRIVERFRPEKIILFAPMPVGRRDRIAMPTFSWLCL